MHYSSLCYNSTTLDGCLTALQAAVWYSSVYISFECLPKTLKLMQDASDFQTSNYSSTLKEVSVFCGYYTAAPFCKNYGDYKINIVTISWHCLVSSQLLQKTVMKK